MSHSDVLLELGCEELPAQGLTALAQALAEGISAGFAQRGVESGSAQALWTPRRLCVLVHAVAFTQADQASERRGPARAAAHDAAGQPSRALLGFATSCGVEVADLSVLETDKGAWYVHRTRTAGKRTAELLPEIVSQAVAALPIAKPMRWGAHEYAFLRPLHWFVLLLGEHVVPAVLLGIRSGRTTYGHRFHAPGAITLARPADYVSALRQAFVEVDPGKRRALISLGAQALANQVDGQARIAECLLDEVCNLTEWPVPLRCAIPDEYMRLPAAIITNTIESHQKFFPILKASGELLPAFIGVANIDSSDPEQIRHGYERVVRPRLADAAFFFEQDLQTPLASYQEQLARVTFQAKLGSVWDKSRRVALLAETIAPQLCVDPQLAGQAARLAKCDLLSRVVGEFPELQGAMARTYALAQGESAELALSLDEVYSPRQAGAPIASSALGRTLAIAERLDTLAGIFAVGLKPTGNKDAFGLRRAALGLARTLIEGQLRVDLPTALAQAVAQTPNAQPGLAGELYQFIVERLASYYADQQIGSDLVEAVAERKPSDLRDFDLRVKALQAFKALPECQSLVAANKRIRNILRKAEASQAEPVSAALFEHPAEHELNAAIVEAARAIAPLIAGQDYVPALHRLAQLRAPIDGYFEAVMVMAEDLSVRRNRLASLQELSQLFLQVADVAVLSA